MTDILLRLRALFLRKRVEQELDEELDLHLEMQTRKNLAAGMDAEQARRSARIQFGADPGAVKDYVRDTRRINFLETLFQDILYALRGFRQKPLFALTVTGTIAIGLGWNTAVFTVFNTYVLRPQAVRDPYSLYSLNWSTHRRGAHGFTWDQYQELKASQLGFSEAYASQFYLIRVQGRPAYAELVSGDYFQILGVKARIGRTLLPEDTRTPGVEPVVVIGEAAWKTRFGAAPDIVGRKISIHGQPFIVAGVIGEEFSGLGGVPRDFWVPITMSHVLEEGNEFRDRPEEVGICVRLKPGVSEDQAQAAILGWMQRQTERFPPERRAAAVHLESEAYGLPLREFIGPFLPIGLAFLLVLLSACANVANMMLARAMSRQREIGIRLSLGAARSRLIRQLLTESVLLAFPAGAAALFLSQTLLTVGTRTLFATLPAEFVDYVHLIPLHLDFRVFFFMIAAAIGSAVLFGLAPALQATRMNVMQAARGDFSSEFRPSRLRNALVVAQVTVCALLLIASGILLRGAQKAASVDNGLRIRDVIEVSIQEKSRARVLAKLASDPTVELVASTSSVPLDDAFATVTAASTGAPNPVHTSYNYVSPEYFELFGLTVLRGRTFSVSEAASGADVTVISETAARQFFGGQEALGQSIGLTRDVNANRVGRLAHNVTVRVVGIVRDSVVTWKRDQPEMLCLYLPNALAGPHNTLLVRARGDTDAARRRLDAALEEGDPGAVQAIHRLQEIANGVAYGFRASYWIAAAVGCIALLLTLSGVYGVLSYLVAQRTKEIGIRLALGASIGIVTGAVLKQCMRLALLGTAIGALLALGASQLFASVIQMINTFDRIAYLGGMALVLATCLCASYFPARRAARVDPITTLRYD